MGADETPKNRSDSRGAGPSFTTSGAIPGASEVGWNTANPDADATKPDSLPDAVAESMETDEEVEDMPAVQEDEPGPEMSMAGAMPGGSETSWTTAYPSPDASKPETMPSSMNPDAETETETEDQV